jgi:hypothetical protein
MFQNDLRIEDLRMVRTRDGQSYVNKAPDINDGGALVN